MKKEPPHSGERLFDWTMALIMSGWGYMESVGYKVFPPISIINHSYIGPTFLCIGIIWGIFLYINGDLTPSPIPRAICALINVTMWSWIEAETLISTVNEAKLIYGVITLSSFIACARCGTDAGIAFRRIFRKMNLISSRRKGKINEFHP